MLISCANPQDHELLSDITFRSKAYWGYSKVQLKAWKEDLTISPDYIKENNVFKIDFEGEVCGYYSYFAQGQEEVLLDNLFLLPEVIGKGIGRMLLEDFIARVKSATFSSILLYSDPHAEGFYGYFGFKVIGQKETSIKGRFLPIMRLEI